MKFRITVSSIILSLSALAGCAGGNSAPVSVTKPTDAQLSCAQMSSERENLLSEMQAIASGGSNKSVPNVDAGAGGLIFFPSDFLRGMKKADAKALLNRQARYNQLVNLSLSKNCKLK